MCRSQLHGRAIALARGLADSLEHCGNKPELDFEGKRLHVLLEVLHRRDNNSEILKAHDRSRDIYLANTLDEAHAAAHEVADILTHVA